MVKKVFGRRIEAEQPLPLTSDTRGEHHRLQ